MVCLCIYLDIENSSFQVIFMTFMDIVFSIFCVIKNIISVNYFRKQMEKEIEDCERELKEKELLIEELINNNKNGN